MMNRRQFLTGAGAVALSSSLAGCGMGGGAAPSQPDTGNNSTGGQPQLAPPSINPQQYADQFGAVVNMAEAGADPTGEEDVVPIIERWFDDDTLLYFPSGTYTLNSNIRRVGYRDVGIVGQGAVLKHGRVDAIHGFKVTSGEYDGKAQHFKIGTPSNPHRGKFIFGGFVADWRAENTGMQILNHHTAGESVVQNVKAVGIHGLGCQGPFRLNPATDSARIVARDIDIRHGGKTYQYTINTRKTRSLGGKYGRSLATSGITMHPDTRGTLILKRVLCGGWPDNGIYAIGGGNSKAGTTHVRNCVSANSQASNIRIGGVDSTISNCLIITDNDFGKRDFYFEQRPIRLDQGTCSVSNTKIIQKLPTGWSVTVQEGVDQATLSNLKIELHAPERGIVIDDHPEASLELINFRTPGWTPVGWERENLIYGTPETMTGITVNGEPF